MINLIKIESKRDTWVSVASAEYEKKISRYTSFKTTSIKGEKLNRTDAEYKKISDSALLLKHIDKTDFNILFDEQGKKMNSLAFSNIFVNFQNSGKKKCNLLIGGPYGVTDQLKQNTNLIISLSDFTFNHWIAELVILEQVYRAFTIIKKIPYHND